MLDINSLFRIFNRSRVVASILSGLVFPPGCTILCSLYGYYRIYVFMVLTVTIIDGNNNPLFTTYDILIASATGSPSVESNSIIKHPAD